MDKSLKKYRILIIILMLVIIVIVGFLIVLKQEEKQKQIIQQASLNDNEYQQDLDNYEPDTKVSKVNDTVRYYKVKNIIDKYFSELAKVNANPQTELQKDESDMSISIIMEMLSKEYKGAFSITEQNIIEEAEKYRDKDYNINNMYTLSKTLDMRLFLVELGIQDVSNSMYFLIVIDYENSTFEIYEDNYVRDKKYNENMDSLVNFEANKIEEGLFNKVENVSITNEDMAVNYFNDYKYKLLNDSEKAYNVLETEYRQKRFSNIDEYKQFIAENSQYLYEIKPVQYILNQYDDYNEYVCKDQYGNLYIFTENAVMDYTLKLDTYTVMTQKFQTEYLAANDEKKALMDIDKFIQMINNYDYTAAYKVLNETFKTNNFESQQAFKEYMQKTYYRFNDISLSKYSNENGVFVYKATITNKQNTDETKEFNIILKLNEGTEFEMSFEIIE